MNDKNNVMEQFLAEFDNNQIHVGDTVEAVVAKVEDTTIYLDLNGYAQTEGRMHLNEYTKDPEIKSFKGLVRKGQKITAVVQKVQDEPALILLSTRPLNKAKEQKELTDLCERQEKVVGVIKSFNKGGALVLYKSYEIFIPFNNLDFNISKNQEEYLNKEIEFIIQEANFMRRMPKFLGTRRPIYEAEKQKKQEEYQSAREAEISKINEGDVLEGVIVDVKEHAALVKFETITGLLRLSQVSHIRINKITDRINLNDKVKVKVLKKDGFKLDLSIKALEKTPFELFKSEVKQGDKISGVIAQKLPFGFFIKLREGLVGLLHRNEFSWDPKDTFKNQAKIGDEVLVKVCEIKDDKEQIVLSRKALIDNPWENIKFERNDNVEAVIDSFLDDRVVVFVGNIKAYILNSEMDCKEAPSKVFQKDEKIMTKVKYINTHSWILELSQKRYADEILEKELQESVEKELAKNKK